MPGQHSPIPVPRLLPPVMGSMLEFGVAIPVHFDDYALFKSPLSDFRAEVTRRGIVEQVRFVDRGHTLPLTRLGAS